MAGFNTQFHVTLDELCDFIESWLDEHPIVISAFGFPPKTRIAIDRATVREVLARPDVNDVAFTRGPVDPSLTSGYAVARADYKGLHLNIGRLKPDGLEQSSWDTTYDDPIWIKMNKDLRRRTTAGADYVDDATGNVDHFVRNARFSAGAKALSATGTPLRPPGPGWDTSFRPK